MLECRLASSLDKIFTTGENVITPIKEISVLKGERTSFQVAFRYFPKSLGVLRSGNGNIKIEGFSDKYEIFYVKSVPVTKPTVPGQVDILRGDAGFFPDALIPKDECPTIPGQWQSFWINLYGETPGEYEIKATISCEGEESALKLCVKVLSVSLLDVDFKVTQWLHGDCISNYHGVEMYSDRYWEILKNYMKTATEYGLNTVLTPIFTPPLDTEVGTYRKNSQLVKVDVFGDNYEFDFSWLKKWVNTARSVGFKYFELSHLFSQWGAKYAAPVYGYKGGGFVRLFGWDVPSDSPQYLEFLRQFFVELSKFLEEEDLLSFVFMHISDEPNEDHIDKYEECVSMIRKIAPKLRIMDAMGDYEIYKKSGIDVPVVSLNNMDAFVENKVNPLWGYYCCAQFMGTSNRFYSMPSVLHRIIGIQAYIYGIEGFLHWGYNFYNSFLSLEQIDPYIVTDGNGSYPGGDAISVYPYEDGCIPSLRMVVFAEALGDLRALTAFEKKIGREGVLAFINESLGEITWEKFPRESVKILEFREELNRCISSVSA